MQIDIVVETDAFAQETEAYLDATVRPAIADGLNIAAGKVIEDLQQGIRDSFPNPTPFTIDAFDIVPASFVRGRDPSAEIFIKDIQARYLDVHIHGGVRRAGDWGTTPEGPLVPGPDAKLTRHGSLPRGYVKKMERREDVFWTTLGMSDKPALVQRDGDKLKVLALVVDELRFEPKFPFADIVSESAARHIPAAIEAELLRRAKAVDSD